MEREEGGDEEQGR